MLKNESITKVYEGVVDIRDVLAYHNINVYRKRIPSPQKHDTRDKDVAINFETNSFMDFYTGISGDAVQLHYYLQTGGAELPMERGSDAEYFKLKSQLLGINIDGLSKVEYFPQKKYTEPYEEVTQAKKLDARALSLNNGVLYQLLSKKDKTLITQHMMGRGLTEKEALTVPFVMAPVKHESYSIANDILKQNKVIKGTPGFYNDNHGKFRCRYFKDDIFMIPIVNVKGQMVSFQMRSATESSGYWSFSSAGDLHGCSPGTPIGMWGNPKGHDTVILTEGGIKAYITWLLTGIPTVYVLGVNSLSDLHSSMEYLKTVGIKKVLLCYDMDSKTNKNVEKALKKCKNMLETSGMSVKQMTWREEFKGIDDYLIAARKAGKLEEVVKFLKK